MAEKFLVLKGRFSNLSIICGNDVHGTYFHPKWEFLNWNGNAYKQNLGSDSQVQIQIQIHIHIHTQIHIHLTNSGQLNLEINIVDISHSIIFLYISISFPYFLSRSAMNKGN